MRTLIRLLLLLVVAAVTAVPCTVINEIQYSYGTCPPEGTSACCEFYYGELFCPENVYGNFFCYLRQNACYTDTSYTFQQSFECPY